jgi:hypothetical protein
MTKDEALELCDYLEGNDASLEAQCKAAAFIREALAQPAQEYWGGVDFDIKTTPPAAQEPNNFCPRCGKRLEGVLGRPQMHTCTPPLWGHK